MDWIQSSYCDSLHKTDMFTGALVSVFEGIVHSFCVAQNTAAEARLRARTDWVLFPWEQ